MSSPRITVTQEHADGRVTKWVGSGEVEYSADVVYTRLMVISPDLRRVGLVAPWFDVDPPREGTPKRWTERAEDEEQGR